MKNVGKAALAAAMCLTLTVSLGACGGGSKPAASSQAATPIATPVETPAATPSETVPDTGNDKAYCTDITTFAMTMSGGAPTEQTITTGKTVIDSAPSSIKKDWGVIIDMLDLYMKYDGNYSDISKKDSARLMEIASGMGDAGVAIDKETKDMCGVDFGFSKLADLAG